jgi:error-prone DNA polymerase
MAQPEYAELHCHSNFSFLRGASHPEELVAQAAELGYRALALTDECSFAGVVRAHQAAREHELQLLLGTELRLDDGLRLLLLVTDRGAYGDLCELITRARRRAPKGEYRLARGDLQDGLATCLAVWLPGGCADVGELQWLAEYFPQRTWVGVELHAGPNDQRRLDSLRELAVQAGVACVATGDVHMHRRGRRALQDTLTAIRIGKPVAAAGGALFPNGERHLRPRSALQRLYPLALLEETVRVAARCSFSLDELRYEYPEELVPAGETPASWLRQLSECGARGRWPEGVPVRVQQQMEHELALIAELRYEPYFLTVHDIVDFARRRGILCQGRGSAANSAVCYSLGITEVDPARMEMLFERFISRERNEPPDIDVDFEHERREEVLQYVYEKYGRERAALAATVICYRSRSAVREVAKALGFDPVQVERLAEALGWDYAQVIDPQRLREAGFDPEAPALVRLRVLVGEILGFPRHLSQHVGGFVISRGPLCRLVPIENAAMPQRTVIQWDKNDLDALGLLKVDCLALGMLSAIRRALALLQQHRGLALSLAQVPAEDPEVYAMIQRADTMGVFQIESRAQMGMLPRLRPACFYDLVIEVAIVRPGPIQGGMVHPYLRRRTGEEPVSYPNPAVQAVLQRTLGVPIFQEQVMQLAVAAAGFTPGEADQLRRAMAAWRRRGDLELFRQRFIEGMRGRGYEQDFAERLFKQVQGFGEYGFPESHAASFALLVYVSAWLKCHHPAVFCCALLNSQPMGFYAPAQLVQDARRHGVEVRPVAVNRSGWDSSLETADDGTLALRLGLRLVKGLSHRGAEALVAERERNGLYTDVVALAERAALGRRDLRALAESDALLEPAGDRHQAAWEVLGLEPGKLLGQRPRVDEAAPSLPIPGVSEGVVADYASLGLSLRCHPLSMLRRTLQRRGLVTAAKLRELTHGQRVATAGLVINRQRPSTAKGVIFATLEDESGYINVIVPQRVADRHRRILLAARLLAVRGVVEREGEVVQLLARRLDDLSGLLGTLQARSRDFH